MLYVLIMSKLSFVFPAKDFTLVTTVHDSMGQFFNTVIIASVTQDDY